MKSFTKSVLISFASALALPAFVQAASVAQVLSEDPDGAMLVGASSSSGLVVGSSLSAGDVIATNGATVVIGACDGSLITVYPNSEVTVTAVSANGVTLKLTRGEILGDTTNGCPVTVQNPAGSANISDGVYGVLLNETGDGWTLQVRNLDGSVNFTAAPTLSTADMQVSLVEPGKTLAIPAGEEMVLRGIYNSDADSFELVRGGAALAVLSDETVAGLQSASSAMSAVGRPDDLPARDKAVPVLEGTPGGDNAIPVIIEIPWQDVEPASDRG